MDFHKIETAYRQLFSIPANMDVEAIGTMYLHECNVALVGMLSECSSRADNVHRYHAEMVCVMEDLDYIFCILPLSILDPEFAETGGHLTEDACRLYLVDEVDRLYKGINTDIAAMKGPQQVSGWRLIPGMLNSMAEERYEAINNLFGKGSDDLLNMFGDDIDFDD